MCVCVCVPLSTPILVERLGVVALPTPIEQLQLQWQRQLQLGVAGLLQHNSDSSDNKASWLRKKIGEAAGNTDYFVTSNHFLHTIYLVSDHFLVVTVIIYAVILIELIELIGLNELSEFKKIEFDRDSEITIITIACSQNFIISRDPLPMHGSPIQRQNRSSDCMIEQKIDSQARLVKQYARIGRPGANPRAWRRCRYETALCVERIGNNITQEGSKSKHVVSSYAEPNHVGPSYSCTQNQATWDQATQNQATRLHAVVHTLDSY
jgi:hypothetical protein